MWNLPLDTIAPRLQEEGGLPGLAIETGTCRGNGTRALARRFERVISIELSEGLWKGALERFSGPEYAHVRLLNGNSAELLPGLLRELPADERVFFFLDAHWSGDRSVNWSAAAWKGYGIDTAHLGSSARPTGPEQCPLRHELEAIVAHCRGRAYVLIDDLKNLPPSGPGLKDREFPGEDWSHLSRELILSIASPRLRMAEELSDPSQLFLILD